MAATYVRIVNDIERRQTSREPAVAPVKEQAGPLGLGSLIAAAYAQPSDRG
jgi:hypothetical protein